MKLFFKAIGSLLWDGVQFIGGCAGLLALIIFASEFPKVALGLVGFITLLIVVTGRMTALERKRELKEHRRKFHGEE